MRFFSFIAVFSFFFNCFSQQVKEYDKDFEFREGIYLNFQQFRNNKPIEKEKIISEFIKTDIDFFKQVIQLQKVKFIDSAGVEQSVSTSELWGYSSNNSIHVYYKEEFNRIPLIGSLCHFTAMVVYYGRYRDPYTFGGGGMNTISIPSKQLEQFILDMDSGTIYPFSVGTMENLLQKDKPLLDEFMALKKKQKRDSVFLYLRKYNQKHPLVFSL